MAVVAVEPAIENMLEEAGALPRHYRIALNRLKITIVYVESDIVKSVNRVLLVSFLSRRFLRRSAS